MFTLCSLFVHSLLTLCSLCWLFGDYFEEKPKEALVLEPSFSLKIVEGRGDHGESKAYLTMYERFGDMFCFVEGLERRTFFRKVAQGADLDKLITPTMEALMVTILEVGCGTDWSKLRQQPDYIAHMKHKREPDKWPSVERPVSFMCVLFCHCNVRYIISCC